jgi:2-hydroxy-6-oxonona-2,4-dienedioate hydrolase
MVGQKINVKLFTPKLESEVTDLVLLHGLFGNLSNWERVHSEFKDLYRVHPQLPLFDFSFKEGRLDYLVTFLHTYIESENLGQVVLVGNSLGGHVALLYALRYPQKVQKIVLAGSSGLFENSFNGTFPRVKDRDYIGEKVKQTFYKKEVVTDALVDEVFEIVQSRVKTLSIIGLARAAQKQNLAAQLVHIKAPVLLVWGLQDEVTPPHVALEFEKILPNAELCFIDECGHVPMMEQPVHFNKYLKKFLES